MLSGEEDGGEGEAGAAGRGGRHAKGKGAVEDAGDDDYEDEEGGGYEGGGAPVAGATSSSSSSKSSLQLGAGCLDKSAAGGSCTSCLSSYTQSFVLRGGACGALCV